VLRTGFAVVLACAHSLCAQAPATAIPLVLPTNIAIDAQGNLYVSETGKHVVRRVDAQGQIVTVAGSGMQGFDGDGGAATSALLDSPLGLAVGNGGLYIADSHNHRVRRVDLVSGVIATVAGGAAIGSSGDGGRAVDASLDRPSALALDGAGNLFIADAGSHRIRRIDTIGTITTVAGTGAQGMSADGGAAASALLDSPEGLAVDSAGNIYVADSHNNRVRRIDSSKGTITTVAGTGAGAFAGDSASATSASLALPKGISIDGKGNIYIADSSNHRLRRVDASTGAITTVAGDGVQGYSGEGEAPTESSLNAPYGVAVAGDGSVDLVDAGNARVRQITADSSLQTVAGLGVSDAGALTISGPSSVTYGTGQILATLNSASASGVVTFLDVSSANAVTLNAINLQAGKAVLDLSSLDAGQYSIKATYIGDQTHSAAQSAVYALIISPQALSVTVAPSSMEYGSAAPALQAALSGLLARDQGKVSATAISAAGNVSSAGLYPVAVTLGGAAAHNYTIAAMPAFSVVPARTSVSLTASGSSVSSSQTVTLTARVFSSTGVAPFGRVSIADGGVTLGAGAIDGQRVFTWSSSTLSAGAHTLTASFTGDTNFGSSVSPPSLVTVGEGSTAAADFTMTATGTATQTIVSGSSASFSFVVQPQSSLASQVSFAVSGLPSGSTAAFNPGYVPPGASPATVTLTITTLKSAGIRSEAMGITVAGLVVFLGLRRRRYCVALLAIPLILLSGCGDRIATSSSAAAASKSYVITVTGTATGAGGVQVQHSTAFTLIVVPSN